ncbi:cathelicidin-5-like isoform X1 [Dendrobates tinctorius]|uniref:cathelicidin-5-like isoform X1 n=1 Tax=Dendrobates tinctorius TaxID=92724 RepID=UPI003CCA27A7
MIMRLLLTLPSYDNEMYLLTSPSDDEMTLLTLPSDDNEMMYLVPGRSWLYSVISHQSQFLVSSADVRISPSPRNMRNLRLNKRKQLSGEWTLPLTEAMMRSWRLSLLLVSAVTLHGCLSVTSEPRINDGRSIGDITDLYNQKEGVTYLYKSLDQIHIAPPEDGKIPDGRYFIIKETVCLRSEDADLSQCDFKPDGDVKFCALDLGDDGSTEIQCISQNKVVRVRRSGKKKKCNNIICKLFPSGSTSVIAGGSNPGRGVVA